MVNPKGHFGTGLVFAMPYGIFGMLAAPFRALDLGIVFISCHAFESIIESWAIGWASFGTLSRAIALGSTGADLLGFAVWCASYPASARLAGQTPISWSRRTYCASGDLCHG